MTKTETAVLVTPVRPASSGNGLAMRAGVLLEGLARSHRVHVVIASVFEGGPVDDLLDSLAATVTVLDLETPIDPRTEALSLLATAAGRERAAALQPRPDLCASLSTGSAQRVAALAREASVVWTLRLYLAPLLDELFDDADARPRLVIDLDDLDTVVQRQLGRSDQAAAFERLADYYLPRADLVTAAAAHDVADIGRRHRLQAGTALPNAIRAPAHIEAAQVDYELLFVGNLSYEPNVDAAVWLATELAPKLDRPRIAIVGSNPTPAVEALAQLEGVSVIADVPDVAPYYARSMLAVAPLSSGGGTRIKVIEALAHGRPVIATPLGAEGIPLGHENGVVIAERSSFAAACRQLLDDHQRAESLGRAGREAALRDFSVEVVAGLVDRLTRDILAT